MATIANGRGTTGRPLRTGVIVGSTREGRIGAAIARWFAERAQQSPELDIELIDLADFDFPARYPRRAPAAVNDFLARIDRSDAFVIVTPEYNHGYPAALKQAIDYGCDEWFGKPAAFVAYGMAAQGLRGVEQLRLVLNSLHVATVRDVVSFSRFDGTLNDDGSPRDTDAADASVQHMLSQLTWWAHALRDARAERAFAA